MGLFSKKDNNVGSSIILDKKPHIVFIKQDMNVIMLIDASTSMNKNDVELTDYKSRFKYAEQQTIALATEGEKVDANGIDVIVFSNNVQEYWNTTAKTVEQAFARGTIGSTETAKAIRAAYNRHVDIESKSTLILIVTDGVPNSQNSVKKEIVRIAKAVGSPKVFSICFLTVGKLSSSTKNWLIKLDEDLENTTNGVDIVAVEPLCGASFKATREKAQG